MWIRNIRYRTDKNSSYQLKDVLITEGTYQVFDLFQSPDIFPEDVEQRDAQGAYTFMPGLFDAHVHGQGGADFADVGDDPNKLPLIMKALGETGVSYVMATLVSMPIPKLKKALEVIDYYVEKQLSAPVAGTAFIAGIHLEGPFIAANCKGAHDINALQKSISLAEFEGIISAAPHVKEWKITLAPDLPGAIEFIENVKNLKNNGISVKVFLGHTNADKNIIDSAIKAGAVGFTHLGNACLETCCRDTHPLEIKDAKSNLVQWVLENPKNCPPGVELIVDGAHLSHSFVLLVNEVLKNKILLVTDDLGPSGQNDGVYKLGSLDIYKEGNVFYLIGVDGNFIMKDITLPDGTQGKVKTLAGSAAPLSLCIQTYVQWACQNQTAKDSMEAIYTSAIENPRISSLSKEALARLAEHANFSIFNETGQLVMSLCNGNMKEHLPAFSRRLNVSPNDSFLLDEKLIIPSYQKMLDENKSKTRDSSEQQLKKNHFKPPL